MARSRAVMLSDFLIPTECFNYHLEEMHVDVFQLNMMIKYES